MTAPDLLYGGVLAAYLLVLAYVTVYCLMQLHLLSSYLRDRRAPSPSPAAPARWPTVTVQLPLYNERYVATRIIDAVCGFDYPTDRLQVQVLDDSTDDTVDIVAHCVMRWRAAGIDIEHVRRERRHGFKAGALADAMSAVTGEFIAIFDADFVPAPDFLKTSIPHFDAPEVGVVQSRWEHLNEDYSIITRLQALQLNVHFTVEQRGRRAAGLFAQFNGTAGVWRRACIEDAGGWRALTLTEDLDLSVRAQLRDWQIRYLEDNRAPAELPMEMSAFKSQQHRWMKGGAECSRILLPQVWRSRKLTLTEKLHSSAHLLGSSIFVFVFLIGVLSLPTALAVIHFDLHPALFSVFLSATLAVGAVYWVANVQSSWREESTGESTWRFLVLFPAFLSLSMGLSLHNGIAVLQGFWGKRSEFVRTPKFALDGSGAQALDRIAANVYRGRRWSWITVGEGVLALTFAAATVIGILTGYTFFSLFHAMLAVGYGTIFGFTVRHASLRPKPGAAAAAPPAVSKHSCERLAAASRRPPVGADV